MILPSLVVALTLNLLSLAISIPAHADVSTVGAEFQVNSFTLGEQRTDPARSVARGPSGEFVVVWVTDGEDGDESGVSGQLYDAHGGTVGSQFQVNTYTTGHQRNAAVAMGGTGTFAVVWESEPASCATNADCTTGVVCDDLLGTCGVGQDGDARGVFLRLYDVDGSALTPETQANTYTAGSQNDQVVAMDAAGNFLVVWETDSFDGSANGVAARRFDAAGAALDVQEFVVNTHTAGGQRDPAVAWKGDGGYIVVWEGAVAHDDSGKGIAGQRLDELGSPSGTEFFVNEYTTGEQVNPSVAASPADDGDFVVVWESEPETCATNVDCSGGVVCDDLAGRCGTAQDGDARGVFARRFAGDGTATGGAFQVNTYATGDQDETTVAVNSDGTFLVAWERDESGGAGLGIFAQAYDASGNAVGGELPVNTETADSQSDPSLATGGVGNMVAVWESDGQDGDKEGVFAQLLCTDADLDGACDLRCGLVPARGCRLAGDGKSTVQINRKSDASKNKMKWAWKKGEKTELAAFRDPVEGDPGYVVCVYDSSGAPQPQLEAQLLPGGTCDGKPCWKPAGQKGYKYKNKAATPDGLTSAVLKSGAAGKARILVKAKGADLPAPELPLVGEVTVQLMVGDADGTGGDCWQTTFNAAIKNDSRKFKAKGP